MATVEQLMDLLADLTGWDDQCLSVKIGYKRARIRTAQDESHLDSKDKGFTVATSICGSFKEDSVTAQGKSLEEALRNLAGEVVNYRGRVSERWGRNYKDAAKSLREFEEHYP